MSASMRSGGVTRNRGCSICAGHGEKGPNSKLTHHRAFRLVDMLAARPGRLHRFPQQVGGSDRGVGRGVRPNHREAHVPPLASVRGAQRTVAKPFHCAGPAFAKCLRARALHAQQRAAQAVAGRHFLQNAARQSRLLGLLGDDRQQPGQGDAALLRPAPRWWLAAKPFRGQPRLRSRRSRRQPSFLSRFGCRPDTSLVAADL